MNSAAMNSRLQSQNVHGRRKCSIEAQQTKPFRGMEATGAAFHPVLWLGTREKKAAAPSLWPRPQLVPSRARGRSASAASLPRRPSPAGAGAAARAHVPLVPRAAACFAHA